MFLAAGASSIRYSTDLVSYPVANPRELLTPRLSHMISFQRILRLRPPTRISLNFNSKYTRPYRYFSAIRCGMASATTFYDLKPLDSKDQVFDFNTLKGKVVLIVNVASQCGFACQYEGLEKLYEKYQGDGLVVLGFPCNQFGEQEPGTAEEIQNFCTLNYGVKFPVLGKIDVNGDHASPVYEFLKNQKSGLLGLKRIKWNYEKFLVARDGKVVERWASTSKPETLASAIEKELGKAAPKSEL